MNCPILSMSGYLDWPNRPYTFGPNTKKSPRKDFYFGCSTMLNLIQCVEAFTINTHNRADCNKGIRIDLLGNFKD